MNGLKELMAQLKHLLDFGKYHCPHRRRLLALEAQAKASVAALELAQLVAQATTERKQP